MIITPNRNIVKRTVLPPKEADRKPAFKRNPLGKYTFPTQDNVPPGIYISKIDAVIESKTRKGEDSYDVCYRIADAVSCYKKVNGLLPADEEIEYHYIRQRYVYGTEFDDQFVEAMYNTGVVDDEFDFKDVIGITEKINLIYKADGGLGSIDKRVPTSKKALKQQYQAQMAMYSDEEEYVD